MLIVSNRVLDGSIMKFMNQSRTSSSSSKYISRHTLYECTLTDCQATNQLCSSEPIEQKSLDSCTWFWFGGSLIQRKTGGVCMLWWFYVLCLSDTHTSWLWWWLLQCTRLGLMGFVFSKTWSSPLLGMPVCVHNWGMQSQEFDIWRWLWCPLND